MFDADPQSCPHVTVDADGHARVSGTRLKVIHLVRAQRAGSLSVEQLVEEYPPLTLLAVQAALTYYEDHRTELDETMRRDDEYAERMRPLLDDGTLRAKLIARREAWNSKNV